MNNIVPMQDDEQKIKAKLNLIVKSLNDFYETLPKWIKKSILEDNIRVFRKIEESINRGFIFITIQGSLKTGKSTLTNLLAKAKKEIAITKLGQDTTAIPYVISKSPDKNYKMIIFEKKGSLKKNEREFKNLLDQIIDYIKGYDLKKLWGKSKKEMNFIEITKENPTKEDIEKYTVEINENVLLVNIQVPKEEFKEENLWILDHNAAILDTPGIEGKKASEKELLMKQIEKNTNIVVAMQSSVTPFNVKEKESLKRYSYVIADNNFYFLHNRFELKPWADEIDKKNLLEAERESIKSAKKIINSEFGIDPLVHSINLEKAKDYIFSNKKKYKYNLELKEEYQKLLKFEKLLVDKINTNRKTIFIENSKRQLTTALKEVMDVIETIENELINKRNEIKEEKALFNKLFIETKKELRNIDNKIIKELTFDKEFKKILDIKNEYKNIKIFENSEIDISILDKILVFDSVDKDYNLIFEKTKRFNEKLLNELRKEVQKYLKEQIKNYLDKNYLDNFKKLKDKLKDYNIFMEIKEEKIIIPEIDITYDNKLITLLDKNNIIKLVDRYIEKIEKDRSLIAITLLGKKTMGYKLKAHMYENELRDIYSVEEKLFLDHLKGNIEKSAQEYVDLDSVQEKFEKKFKEKYADKLNIDEMLDKLGSLKITLSKIREEL